AGLQYRWLSWSDAGAISHTVAPTSATTFTATFRSQYLLTMIANPGGTVTPASGFLDSLANVVITAIPNEGFGFSPWSATGTGSYNGTQSSRTTWRRGPVC